MVLSSSGFAFTSTETALSNVSINILGTVVSADYAVNLFDGSVTSVTDVNVVIGETGTILSDELGLIFDFPDAVTLTNHGLIATTNDVVQFATLQGDVSIINTGIMSSSEAAVTFISSGSGVAEITNSGSMISKGIDNDETIESNAQLILNNSGLISADNGFAIGAFTQDDFVFNSGDIFGKVTLSSGNNTVINAGKIVGDVTSDSGVDTVENSGDIFGDVNLGSGLNIATNTGEIFGDIQGGSSTDVVRNSGAVFGDVFLSSGNNTVTNSGTIDGNYLGSTGVDIIRNSGEINGIITLGDNDDVYMTYQDGFVTNAVFGDGGEDRLVGGNDDDIFYGGADNDTLMGRGGEDELYGEDGDDVLSGREDDDDLFGGNGNDTLRGGEGEDRLEGGADNDRLFGGDGDDAILGEDGDDNMLGGAGDDNLIGGDGRDVIVGNSGDDTLNGGVGNDILIGGTGADVFLYTDIADSPDAGPRDTIRDFTRGEDVLSVTGMNGPAFDFLGTGGFSATGAAEIRTIEVAGRGISVFFDVDGDGSSDARIFLNNVFELSEADFIL